jgi:hypothetical protein
MALEKPQVRIDIQFRGNLALAIFSAIVIDRRDAVQHEHVGLGKTTVGRTEQLAMSLAMSARNQIVVIVGSLPGRQLRC